MGRRRARREAGGLSDAARQALVDAWRWVEDEWRVAQEEPVSDPELRRLIELCVNSKTKSYRYVLPTQLSAKIADHSLDARCLQASRGKPGSFDARAICDDVVVPFERDHENVLGGSPEPYVNNPLRCPEVSEDYSSQQRDKPGWSNLCTVLSKIEESNDPEFTRAVLRQTVLEMYRRLQATAIEFPVPRRASLARTLQAVHDFLLKPSQGARPQAVAAALLKACGERFAAWSRVESAPPTTSDTSSGRVADIQCFDEDGNVVVAAEVKDRQLALSHARRKMEQARQGGVAEFFFLVQQGLEDVSEMDREIERQFAAGYNFYVFDVEEFAKVVLALVGELGRVAFLRHVGTFLNSWRARIEDRRDWKNALSQL